MGRRMGSLLERVVDRWPAPGWLREARRCQNPLLVRPGRRERVVAGLGLVALAFGFVIAALLTCQVYADGYTVEGEQAGQRSAISATLASDPAIPLAGSEWVVPALATVSYQWQGAARNGIIPVSSKLKAGDRVSVWVDPAGMITQEPRRHTQTVLDTLATGAMGVCALLVAGCLGAAVYRTWSMRRRCAQWEAEWLDFATHGPAPGR